MLSWFGFRVWGLVWVLLKEFILSYHKTVTLLFIDPSVIRYPQKPILIIKAPEAGLRSFGASVVGSIAPVGDPGNPDFLSPKLPKDSIVVPFCGSYTTMEPMGTKPKI